MDVVTIAEKDIKLLWGRAAGRCSAPECWLDLTPLLEKSGPTVLGEMAHVIGRKRGAARSNGDNGPNDSYDNLVLLCPNHHTIADKAEADHPVELLRKWKVDWESMVSGIGIQVSLRSDLIREIAQRLTENRTIFVEWGPKSTRAERTPQSDQAASIWLSRRLSKIVPNNNAIALLLDKNRKFLSLDEWALATQFIEHAQFYEAHCADPKGAEAYLPFPEKFETMIQRIARKELANYRT